MGGAAGTTTGENPYNWNSGASPTGTSAKWFEEGLKGKCPEGGSVQLRGG